MLDSHVEERKRMIAIDEVFQIKRNLPRPKGEIAFFVPLMEFRTNLIFQNTT
jgi:hypothetical protein